MSDQEQGKTGWERGVLERLATASLQEQRRARRWSVFFRFVFAIYVGIILIQWLMPFDLEGIDRATEHTALVDLDGIISADADASADRVVQGLRAAFKDRKTKGIILRINSPGGSPVQSAYIYDEIKRLRGEHPDTPLYAVVSDMCASGGYYVASAADAIYANEASVVGSIGVVMNSFGFVEALDKLGIERRLYTAGDHKGLMDPFSPVNEIEVTHVRALLDDIHGQFIAAVQKGRGDRLNDDDRLYSGLIWTGQQALELGLVDALGSAGYVAREVIGAEEIVDFTRSPDYFQRLFDRFGIGFAKGLGSYFGWGALR